MKFRSVKASLIDDGMVVSGMVPVCQIRTGDHKLPYYKQENRDLPVAPTEAGFVCLFFQ